MSNRKPNKSTKLRKSKKVKETLPAHKLLWGSIAGIATIAGLFASALAFLPRVTIEASNPPDPHNPFTASFTVTNSGAIPLNDVTVTVFPLEISAEPRPFDENDRPPVRSPNIQGVEYPQWAHHRMPVDDRFTITMEHAFVPDKQAGTRFSGADMAIVVHYQPWFVRWERQRQFRFVTHHLPDGSLVWYSRPME
jgi:hypothetical protein